MCFLWKSSVKARCDLHINYAIAVLSFHSAWLFVFVFQKVGWNVRGVKCPWGEMSEGWNVFGVKCLWGEMYRGEMSWGEMSSGWNVLTPVNLRLNDCQLNKIVISQVTTLTFIDLASVSHCKTSHLILVGLTIYSSIFRFVLHGYLTEIKVFAPNDVKLVLWGQIFTFYWWFSSENFFRGYSSFLLCPEH